ncbi:MAG TPA: hypothetical protein VND64_08480 [Pirellulales bacterium]|nr:hypothetical protein [Pirellulales bacterium]
MDFQEALKEVLDAAAQSKQYPSGAEPKELSVDAFDEAVGSKGLMGRAWHESLTPAQEIVCRWIWETCGVYHESWEPFEFGFLCDYNTNHELAVWVRIAHVFVEFVKQYRSIDKGLVVGELCRLSAGAQVMTLKGGRAKALTELWKKGVTD